MEIEWSDPPAKGGSTAWSDFIKELHKHPGQWGKFPNEVKSWANFKYHKEKNTDIEWIGRTIDKKLNVWGRYMSE